MAKAKLTEPYHLRIHQPSDDDARRIAEQMGVDILDVLRMAIKAGLPIIAKAMPKPHR